jgi:succinyl-CoA synthetase beta subunit
MNIHGKAVLREFDVPVPRGVAAFSVEEAVKAAKELGSSVLVAKAQIHAGGRGKAGGVKAGGVKVVHSPEDVRAQAERLYRSRLTGGLDAGEGFRPQSYFRSGCG